MKKFICLFLTIALCLSLCACGGSGVDERYLPLIECLDNHDYEGAIGYVSMFRQEAIENGDIVVLEPQEKDYDLVNRYRNIANALQNYTPDSYFSVWDNTAEKSLNGNAALEFCYNELMALEDVDQWLTSDYFNFEEGFPTDRAALLSRFAIVKDKLLYKNYTTVDNMGNKNANSGSTFYYDEAGTLVMEYIDYSDAEQRWENLYYSSGYYRYTYDDSGKIIEAKSTDLENTNVYAVIVPTYDAAGNMISETITNNDGENVFTYTYDANGNRIQMDYVTDWRDYSVFYTYDAAGNLIQKDRYTYYYSSNEKYVDQLITTVYTYDAAGNMTNAVVTNQWYNTTYENGKWVTNVYSEKIDTVTYVNDANGNLIQEVWQYGETVNKDGNTDKPDLTSKTFDYIYGDYYIFK